MTATRWTLIALVACAAASGVLYVWPDAKPADPGPAAVAAALPLNLPPAVATSVAAARAPLRTPAPAHAAAPAASVPRIGSEGYGAHIERAQASNDAAAAWEAVQWLQQCASNEARRQSFELVRNQGISPDLMTQLMQEADAEGRRCQTVTARHQAMLPELALRAMRGGVPQAAAGYAGSVDPAGIPPALRQEVVDSLRRDANAGHAGSLFGALLTPDAWGLTDTERLGYLYAYGEMTGPQGQAMAKQLIAAHTIRFKAEPTPQQMAAAKIAGQQIIDRVRASGQP